MTTKEEVKGFIWFYINGEKVGTIREKFVLVDEKDKTQGTLRDGRIVHRNTIDDVNWIYVAKHPLETL